jgi:hypothetical protein
MVRAVATCVAFLAALAAPSHAGTSSSQESLTIRLTSTLTAARRVDTAPKGRPNRGDSVTITCALQNRVAQLGEAKGAVVGKDVTVVKFKSARESTSTTTVYLPGGTIRFSPHDSRPGSNSITIPIQGGTGRFAGAEGSLYVRDLDRGAGVSLNVYRLRLP